MNLFTLFLVFMENLNILPAFILCYLPMQGVVRFPLKKLLLKTSLFVLLFIIALSLFVVKTGEPVNLLLLPSFPILFLLYWKTLRTSIYKALTVFLSVISIFSFISLYVDIFSVGMGYGLGYPNITWQPPLFLLSISIGTAALLYLPATTQLRWLVENYNDPVLWNNALAAEVFFFITAILIVPKRSAFPENERIFYLYILIVSALLLSMLYLYYLLYHLARKSVDTLKLELHNQFLGFQAKQYHLLVDYMESTRKLRHDFRQQIATLRQLADRDDLPALKNYLNNYQTSPGGQYTRFCANPAVNAIAAHYREICTENQIPISWILDLPKCLPLPEPDYCVMLGNLLENAVDASLDLPEDRRQISVISYMPTSSILVLVIENAHQTVIRKDKKNFISTKHNGDAIGLASVRETVEHYHGDLRIDYSDHSFTVNILLNL